MKVLMFLFIITISAKSQFISPYEHFNFDYSDNILHPSSIGNFGFDAKLNSYNPNIIQSLDHWFFEAGLMSNISQSSNWDGVRFFKNKTKIYPNFTCQYQNDWLGVQISYKNNIISSMHLIEQLSLSFILVLSFPFHFY